MNPELLIPALAVFTVLARELLWVGAVGILLCSLDDLAVDLLYLWRRLARRRRGGGSALPPLPAPPPLPGAFAILVPAWDEAAVIGPMLRRLLATLQHPSYRLFVGCYPNDPATREAVASIGDPRIRLVTTGHPGPTTKADCLNALWRAVEDEAALGGVDYKAVVLHDAEDVVHPLSLQVYDRFMPALAMVQLPVLPLADRNSRWISGHYLDEFAESHAKDMVVRGLLGAAVPSAGVGTAIDCRALRRLAGADGLPFDSDSLTEDYELGYRLHRAGHKAAMVRVRVGGELVATREYFPATLDAAVRQKSRWLTGIALSGWDRLGWDGSLWARWWLARDRKGLFAVAVTFLAYGAAAMLGGQVLLRSMLEAETGQALPPLFAESGWLSALLWVNAAMLLWRLLWRGLFVARDYGWIEGLRAVPRSLVGNLVNFLAAMRAVDRYQRALGHEGGLRWEKTEHRFPAADAAYRYPAADAAHLYPADAAYPHPAAEAAYPYPAEAGCFHSSMAVVRG